ncbi:MAG: N-6 DNA methylase [Anaerolineae bacterium]|nr:N-6 DNA methylase [Anaerolineae bacterium]
MKEYALYVNSLNTLLEDIISGSSLYESKQDLVARNLDGVASEELRQAIPLEKLREHGTFFTSSSLARRAIDTVAHTINQNSVICDPACGAGDLLIACAEYLPVTNELETTLEIWGKVLRGCDIFPYFVTATKARLVLAAIRRGVSLNKDYKPNLENLFPFITVDDSLQNFNLFRSATHIVINPPFVRVPAPKECNWSNGKVSSAALFIEKCVMHTESGTRIIAILPDVLRSGTNYKKWRELVELYTLERNITLYGQFDKWADVDVFIIVLEKIKLGDIPLSSQKARWNYNNSMHSSRVRDYFSVHVGRVVEYRDPQEGEIYPYITPRALPAWEMVNSSEHSRRFSGLAYESPFVVVRRTSRKGHKHRAVGTLINIPDKVAVENHLLVLIPRNGTIEECKHLLQVLRDDRTNQWLNERILCRHLTVSSLAEIPWWDNPYDNS